MRILKSVLLMTLVSAFIWSCDEEPIKKDVTDIEFGGLSVFVLDSAEAKMEGQGVKLYYVSEDTESFPVLTKAESIEDVYIPYDGDYELVDYLVTNGSGKADFGDLTAGEYFLVMDGVVIGGKKYYVYQYIQIHAGENKRVDLKPDRYYAMFNVDMVETATSPSFLRQPAEGYEVIAVPSYLLDGDDEDGVDEYTFTDLKELAVASGTTDADGSTSLMVPSNLVVSFFYSDGRGSFFDGIYADWFEIGEMEYYDAELDINSLRVTFLNDKEGEETAASGVNVLVVPTDFNATSNTFSAAMDYAAFPVETSGDNGIVDLTLLDGDYDFYAYLSDFNYYLFNSDLSLALRNVSGGQAEEFDVETSTDTVYVNVENSEFAAVASANVAMVSAQFYNNAVVDYDDLSSILAGAIETKTTNASGDVFFVTQRFDQTYYYVSYVGEDFDVVSVNGLVKRAYNNQLQATIPN